MLVALACIRLGPGRAQLCRELSFPLLVRLQGECGNKVVSILFFVTFTLAVPMIMIQLFAAVVIENFEKQQEMEEWRLSPALLEVGLVCHRGCVC